jgi:hypothetical protein
MCKLIGCSHIEAAQEQHLPVLSARCYSVQRLAMLFAVQGSDCCCWIGLKVWQRNFFEMPTLDRNDSTLAHRHRSI